MNVIHRIVVQGSPTGARALIEARLGVETTTRPEGYGQWAIYFEAPKDAILDFLAPDVIEPVSEGDSKQAIVPPSPRCQERYDGIFQCQRDAGHDGKYIHTSEADGRSVDW